MKEMTEVKRLLIRPKPIAVMMSQMGLYRLISYPSIYKQEEKRCQSKVGLVSSSRFQQLELNGLDFK